MHASYHGKHIYMYVHNTNECLANKSCKAKKRWILPIA